MLSLCVISVQYIKRSCLLHLKPTSTPEFTLSVPRWKPLLCDCYHFLHLCFLFYIPLPFPHCIYSLSLILPFSVPVFLTSNHLCICHSLYLCLLALCVCIDFVAVHSPCFSPYLMEGVRWSLRLPNEIKVLFLSLSLFPPNSANPIGFELVSEKWVLYSLIVNPCLAPIFVLCSPSFFIFTPTKFTFVWHFSVMWLPKMSIIHIIVNHTGMLLFSDVPLPCMYSDSNILFLCFFCIVEILYLIALWV